MLRVYFIQQKKTLREKKIAFIVSVSVVIHTHTGSKCGLSLLCIYFYPSNADERLRDLLDGIGKEERDGESDRSVERNCHKDFASRQLVSCQYVDKDSDEDDDLDGHKERRHVQASQVGAFHDFGDFLSVMVTRHAVSKSCLKGQFTPKI